MAGNGLTTFCLFVTSLIRVVGADFCEIPLGDPVNTGRYVFVIDDVVATLLNEANTHLYRQLLCGLIQKHGGAVKLDVWHVDSSKDTCKVFNSANAVANIDGEIFLSKKAPSGKSRSLCQILELARSCVHEYSKIEDEQVQVAVPLMMQDRLGECEPQNVLDLKDYLTTVFWTAGYTKHPLARPIPKLFYAFLGSTIDFYMRDKDWMPTREMVAALEETGGDLAGALKDRFLGMLKERFLERYKKKLVHLPTPEIGEVSEATGAPTVTESVLIEKGQKDEVKRTTGAKSSHIEYVVVDPLLHVPTAGLSPSPGVDLGEAPEAFKPVVETIPTKTVATEPPLQPRTQSSTDGESHPDPRGFLKRIQLKEAKEAEKSQKESSNQNDNEELVEIFSGGLFPLFFAKSSEAIPVNKPDVPDQYFSMVESAGVTPTKKADICNEEPGFFCKFGGFFKQPEKGVFWFCIVLTCIVLLVCVIIGITCYICDKKKKRKYRVTRADEKKPLVAVQIRSVTPTNDDGGGLDPVSAALLREDSKRVPASNSCESSKRNIRSREKAFRKQQEGDNVAMISCSKERDRTVIPAGMRRTPTSSPKESDKSNVLPYNFSAPLTPVPSQVSRAATPKLKFGGGKPRSKEPVPSLIAINSEGNVSSPIR